MKPVLLLTGRPGSGKTSLIKQAVDGWRGKAGGFYTEEIRENGARQGFRLVTLDGQRIVLAHININSPYRVSKYGVDVEGFERVGVAALRRAGYSGGVVVIDEIGKMELFSASFREAVLELIEGGQRVMGTIMLNAHPWADEIKRRPEVEITKVTTDNHQSVLGEIRHWLQAIDATKE